MRFFIVSAIVAAVLFLYPAVSSACEACPADYGLELPELVEKAELITITTFVEEKVPEGLPEDQPDQIVLKVEQVLKGEAKHADDGKIVVNSWNGMCDYGYVVKDDHKEHEHLVILAWDPNNEEYDVFSSGCSYKGAPIVDGKVKIGDEEVPKDEIKAALGL